jgi:hypothetical protein
VLHEGSENIINRQEYLRCTKVIPKAHVQVVRIGQIAFEPGSMGIGKSEGGDQQQNKDQKYPSIYG